MTQEQESSLNVLTLPFAATLSPSTDQGDYFVVTLTGNTTIANPGHALPGERMIFEFIQDATGGRTVTWGNAFNTIAQVAPAPNAVSILSFRFDGAQWQQVAGPAQFPTGSFLNAITAFAGGGQASATQLGSTINRVTTVATAGDSVKLPVSAPGLELTVTNAHATNSLNVFPASGDAINALGANAAFALAAGKTVMFVCAVAGIWNALLSA